MRNDEHCDTTPSGGAKTGVVHFFFFFFFGVCVCVCVCWGGGGGLLCKSPNLTGGRVGQDMASPDVTGYLKG